MGMKSKERRSLDTVFQEQISMFYVPGTNFSRTKGIFTKGNDVDNSNLFEDPEFLPTPLQGIAYVKLHGQTVNNT